MVYFTPTVPYDDPELVDFYDPWDNLNITDMRFSEVLNYARIIFAKTRKHIFQTIICKASLSIPCCYLANTNENEDEKLVLKC